MTDLTAVRPARPADRAGTARLLRVSLLLDGVASAGMGLGLAAGSQVLDSVLGIPAGWLLGLGTFLLAYGAGSSPPAVRPCPP